MFILKKRLWAMVLCGLSTGFPTLAESPALALADGTIWQATLGRGQKIGMIFNTDGTVDVQGFFAPKLRWTPTDDGLCMSGGPRGTTCASLRRTSSGFVGLDGDNVILRLDR